MDTSSSQLASQLPFYTQLQQSHSWLSSDKDRTVINKKDVVDARSEELISLLQPRVVFRENSRKPHEQAAIADTRDAQDNEIPSSSHSVECVPLLPPKQDHSSSQTANPGTATEIDATSDSQPFPLVQWIKKIRQETPKQWPTFPLRWARTISAKQRAILDDDDAWLPALPGRPSRQGTVPVDLLNKLTAKAEQEAASPTMQEHIADPDRQPGSHTGTGVPSPQPVAPSAGSTQSDEDSDGDDNDTHQASQWSSSPPQPPRFQLPPDTSPVRDSGSPKLQHQLQNPSTDHTTKLRHELTDTASRAPAADFEGVISASDSSQKLEANHTASAHSETVEDGVRLSSISSDKQRDKHPKRVTKDGSACSKHSSEVHVEDTPFPPKAAHHIQGTPAAVSIAPQSSFVGATYPDSTPARPDLVPSRALKRAHSQEERHQPESPQSNASGANNTSTANEILVNPSSQDIDGFRSSNHRKSTDIPTSSTKRRRFNDPTVKPNRLYVDPAYQEFDRKRRLERNLFRKSIAKNSKAAQTEETVVSDLQGNQEGTRSSSLPSSPPLSVHRSFGIVSDGPQTSVTNFSMHNSTLLNTPASLSGSGRSLTNIRLNDQILSDVYTNYKAAYQTYRGDWLSFRNAIQLLLKLSSRPREPHQSLWDDFIYRFADDYRVYLQQCLNNSENAIPYQDYYHVYIKRSERMKEVVTPSVIIELQQPSHAPSENVLPQSPNIQNGMTMLSPSNNTIMPVYTPVSNTQEPYRGSRDPVVPEMETLMSEDQAVPTSLQSPTHAMHHIGQQSAITILSSNEKAKAKARRSLPWDKSGAERSSQLTVVRDTERKRSPSSDPETSSKVQKWLLASRAAGAASPELEPATLPLKQRNTTTITKADTKNLVNFQRIAASQPHVLQSIELPNIMLAESSIKAQVTKSKFVKFSEAYAQLQADREGVERTYSARIPINIYSW